jgi:hypothetical protein
MREQCKAEGQVMRDVLLRKYNSMKRWLLAVFIVSAFISYPVVITSALLWCMLRVVGMV